MLSRHHAGHGREARAATGHLLHLAGELAAGGLGAEQHRGHLRGDIARRGMLQTDMLDHARGTRLVKLADNLFEAPDVANGIGNEQVIGGPDGHQCPLLGAAHQRLQRTLQVQCADMVKLQDLGHDTAHWQVVFAADIGRGDGGAVGQAHNTKKAVEFDDTETAPLQHGKEERVDFFHRDRLRRHNRDTAGDGLIDNKTPSGELADLLNEKADIDLIEVEIHLLAGRLRGQGARHREEAGGKCEVEEPGRPGVSGESRHYLANPRVEDSTNSINR